MYPFRAVARADMLSRSLSRRKAPAPRTARQTDVRAWSVLGGDVFLLRAGDEHRLLQPVDHFFADDALLDVGERRQVVHDVEHDFFEDRAQAPRAGLARLRTGSDGGERLFGERELDAVHREDLLILAHQR